MVADLTPVVAIVRELSLTIEQDAEYMGKFAEFMDELQKALPAAVISAADRAALDEGMEHIEAYYGIIQEHMSDIINYNNKIYDDMIEIDKILHPEEYDENEETED